jgi:hypothetical protein
MFNGGSLSVKLNRQCVTMHDQCVARGESERKIDRTLEGARSGNDIFVELVSNAKRSARY